MFTPYFKTPTITILTYVLFYQLEYIASKKHEKKKISERIINAVQTQDPPGRFLEFNATSGKPKNNNIEWYNIA